MFDDPEYELFNWLVQNVEIFLFQISSSGAVQCN